MAAIGVFAAMLAGLTLLPALLTIFGRKGFWPRSGTVAYDPEGHRDPARACGGGSGTGCSSALATALAVTALVFVAGAFGLLAWKVDYSTTNFFKKSVESVEGFELMEEAFPAGTLAPTTILVITT